MTQECRLPSGGLIDRSVALSFRFDGRTLTGYGGDTLASALVANGVRLVGRSFKYHRPRGLFSAGSDEPNALVEIGRGAARDPNTRATTTELFDGLEARSQNRFPSLQLDLLAASGWLAPFLGAGFYYKTFMWPAAFWEKLYEPAIRRAAGLGRLSGVPDPDRYEKSWAHCDLLVIGAGPAGLMAALTAGRAGARVILCDEDFRAGGRLNSERLEIGLGPAPEWAACATDELASMDNVRVMMRTTVFGAYDGGVYGALERVSDHLAEPAAHQPRQRFWRITARRSILAAGALERGIAFAGNDRPGIMLAGAVRSYVNRYAATPGRRVVVFACHDDARRTANDLAEAGIAVVAIIDPRAAEDIRATPAGDVPVFTRARVTAIRGRHGLGAVRLSCHDGTEIELAADCLALSGGWNPAVHLTGHHRGKPRWEERIAAFVPGEEGPPGMAVAGAATGTFSTHGALVQGMERAGEAMEALGYTPVGTGIPDAEDAPVAVAPFWHVTGDAGRSWLDMQNDITVKDVEIAHREGMVAAEHLKRYTTLGMGTDQGKSGNVQALAVMAGLTGDTIAKTGSTAYRPPYTPVAIAAFAGGRRGGEYQPTRLTPAHGWAQARGAAFTEAGQWLRAQWFAQPDERGWRESCDREALAVRRSVGLCDVSTLGKIDVKGRDAAAFLDGIYCNTISTLAVGKVRYGLMLREDGFVMDDGTVARLGENHFLITTTTGNAGPVMQHVDFCAQVLWPDLDAHPVSVTDQFAQFAIAGPKARAVLERLVDRPEAVSNQSLPYMSCTALTICGGVQAWLYRISFSGELGYEVAVAARYGEALAEAISAAGEPFGITPYGLEALNVLRIEKGHPTGGELNGQTTATDLGLGRLISAKKDCIGKVMATRPGLQDPERMVLAGFVPVDRSQPLAAGAHFVGLGKAPITANDEGWMSSACHSPTLGHSIGLGFIRRGGERHGERVQAVDPLRGRETEVEIRSPHFVDPEGERLRV